MHDFFFRATRVHLHSGTSNTCWSISTGSSCQSARGTSYTEGSAIGTEDIKWAEYHVEKVIGIKSFRRVGASQCPGFRGKKYAIWARAGRVNVIIQIYLTAIDTSRVLSRLKSLRSNTNFTHALQSLHGLVRLFSFQSFVAQLRDKVCRSPELWQGPLRGFTRISHKHCRLFHLTFSTSLMKTLLLYDFNIIHVNAEWVTIFVALPLQRCEATTRHGHGQS